MCCWGKGSGVDAVAMMVLVVMDVVVGMIAMVIDVMVG